MPRNVKTAAASGKAALPQLSKQMLEELMPGPVLFKHMQKVGTPQKYQRFPLSEAIRVKTVIGWLFMSSHDHRLMSQAIE